MCEDAHVRVCVCVSVCMCMRLCGACVCTCGFASARVRVRMCVYTCAECLHMRAFVLSLAGTRAYVRGRVRARARV